MTYLKSSYSKLLAESNPESTSSNKRKQNTYFCYSGFGISSFLKIFRVLVMSSLHALEKEMTTHSSVLAWKIPGMGEPGGLPSTGSHRVGHDWSDLAAAVSPPLRFPLPSLFPSSSHTTPLPLLGQFFSLCSYLIVAKNWNDRPGQLKQAGFIKQAVHSQAMRADQPP